MEQTRALQSSSRLYLQCPEPIDTRTQVATLVFRQVSFIFHYELFRAIQRGRAALPLNANEKEKNLTYDGFVFESHPLLG